jgi:hypothetical protein
MGLVIIKAPRKAAGDRNFHNYAITKVNVLKAAGSHAKKLRGVDFDEGGFTIWLKPEYEFGCNESGCAGFEFDSQYDLLDLVKDDCQTIRRMK